MCQEKQAELLSSQLMRLFRKWRCIVAIKIWPAPVPKAGSVFH